MKNLYLLLFLISGSLVQAQIVDIPDANFKNALTNTHCVDTDGNNIPDADADINDDGEIQESEAQLVIRLYVSSQNIASMAGIESFVNLELLFCDYNQLTQLDVTQSPNLAILVCNSNQLTSLDITQSSNLEELWCASNQLTGLDTSQNAVLRRLSCGANNLTALNVTQNPDLEILTCAANNLTSLETQNPSLTGLYCWMNELTNLDLSQNPNLSDLSCRDNQLTSLNVKNGNNINMVTMLAYNNPNLSCIQVDDETATYPECDLDTNLGWCKDDTASYSEKCIFSIDDFDNIDFTLYPNPVQNTLIIKSDTSVHNIEIYSLQGQRVIQTSDMEIEVSGLPSGLYFTSFTINNSSIKKKFIKL